MANRPKRYGGMTRQRQETWLRHRGQGDEGLERARRPQRASEAEIWEREASLNDEDLDMDDDLSEGDELEDLEDHEDDPAR